MIRVILEGAVRIVRQPAQTDVEVVQAMWRAYAEGRVEDMLASIHPSVVWKPLTRPGRSVYVGHSGTLAMMADTARTRGRFRLEWEEPVTMADGRVMCPGRVIQITDHGEMPGARIEPVLTLVDGLVIGLDSEDPRDEH
jgi:ketosteroid isomerase-like protein